MEEATQERSHLAALSMKRESTKSSREDLRLIQTRVHEALVVESLVTLKAGKWRLSCVDPSVPFQVTNFS